MYKNTVTLKYDYSDSSGNWSRVFLKLFDCSDGLKQPEHGEHSETEKLENQFDLLRWRTQSRSVPNLKCQMHSIQK